MRRRPSSNSATQTSSSSRWSNPTASTPRRCSSSRAAVVHEGEQYFSSFVHARITVDFGTAPDCCSRTIKSLVPVLTPKCRKRIMEQADQRNLAHARRPRTDNKRVFCQNVAILIVMSISAANSRTAPVRGIPSENQFGASNLIIKSCCTSAVPYASSRYAPMRASSRFQQPASVRTSRLSQ